MPKIAVSIPAGNGGLIALPLTQWVDGVASGVARPGKASSMVGRDSGFFRNENIVALLDLVQPPESRPNQPKCQCGGAHRFDAVSSWPAPGPCAAAGSPCRVP